MSRDCNCPSIWCRLDSALHRLGWTSRWICDRHDAVILGD